MQLISPCDAIVVGALIIAIDNILSRQFSFRRSFYTRNEDRPASLQAGQFLAKHIPHTKLVELDRPDHIYWLGDNAPQIADLKVNFTAQPAGEAPSQAGPARTPGTSVCNEVGD